MAIINMQHARREHPNATHGIINMARQPRSGCASAAAASDAPMCGALIQGYGFVSFGDPEDFSKALGEMNGDERLRATC
jgi:hypothetical protein